LFAELKRQPDNRTLSVIVTAWKKSIVLQCCRTEVHFESPSKGKAYEVSIIFAADDRVDRDGQPCSGSVLRSARDLIALLIPEVLGEFESRLEDSAPMEAPESLLARLDLDPGRCPTRA
jgi:hypothetical protein